MTTSTKKSGLWKEGFGAIGATLKALEDAGGTLRLMRFIRTDKRVAKAMVEAGSVFLQKDYADEDVASRYAYPDDYSVKPIVEQIETLAKLFGLDSEKALVYTENLPKLPEGAEGWFAIPKWQTVADNYGKAVKKMIALISKSRKLKNCHESQLSEKHLRQSERTEKMFAEFCEQQEGDIIIVPAQFGLRHRGRSGRRVQFMFVDNEFGLGAFANGCMLLTHPKREQAWEQLHINCNGDGYVPVIDGWFVLAPFFNWNGDALCFGAGKTSLTCKQFGSVSGFLPQD